MTWRTILLRGKKLKPAEFEDYDRKRAMWRAISLEDLHGFVAKKIGIKIDDAARTLTVDASHYYDGCETGDTATCEHCAPVREEAGAAAISLMVGCREVKL